MLKQPRALASGVARRSRFGGSPSASSSRTPDARRALTITSSDRPSKREVEPAREKPERGAASLREDPLSHALVEWPFVPIPAAIVLSGRAQAPRCAPSWVIADRCRRVAGAGQPELMFPFLEFSDVWRCRDGGRLQRVVVHTDRNLPMTSRRVPDVVSRSDNARGAGRSIA